MQQSEEMKRIGCRLTAAYYVAGRSLLAILRGGTLDSLVVISHPAMLPLGDKLSPAVRVNLSCEVRTPKWECTCGGYVPDLASKQTFQSYRELNPSSRTIVLGPDCAECRKFSVAHLEMLHAGPLSAEMFMPHFPIHMDVATVQSEEDQWFDEFSVLEQIREDVINRARNLSAQIVSCERNGIKAFAIRLAVQSETLDGREAESLLSNNLRPSDSQVL